MQTEIKPPTTPAVIETVQHNTIKPITQKIVSGATSVRVYATFEIINGRKLWIAVILALGLAWSGGQFTSTDACFPEQPINQINIIPPKN